MHCARSPGRKPAMACRAPGHDPTLQPASASRRHDTVCAQVFENVIEAMVDAVLVVDVEGGVTLTNTAAARLTGYTVEELRGMPIARLLVDETSGLRTVVRRRIEDGAVLRREESWLVPKTGAPIPVSVTGSPVMSDDGLQGIVLVARDIREIRELLKAKESEIALRRKAEDDLRAANASIEEQLEETRQSLLLAERRATLGTLAGGVDEDVTALVRTLLPDLERVAEHITEHGKRLMQLARPGPDHVGPIDLNAVVRDVIAMLRGAGKLRRVTVVTELGPEPLTVTVNRTRIEQILVNLIVNAVDAIGDRNGTITIDVHPSADGKRVVCEVRDTGCGIPPENLPRIFQPFFTTKTEDRGTGLGLPVARGIVESYGGMLVATSTVGAGTTFTFDLPR
ncbi:MAG: PAS domain S-box protein [Deltaproteobacteria bacterium]|nr:MAG: PAS domain S-box protein [Deltaproteobacteria bacterium]